MNLWIDVAVTATLYAVGSITFGHVEETTPKWRPILALLVMMAAMTTISAAAGRAWSVAFVASLVAIAVSVHRWWLPRDGIHPFTAGPKDTYYALRGWTA